ncbi:MAG: globin [Bacteroidia bacterium]
MSTPTIYERLGEENLQLMVNRFYDLVQKNDIISPLFKDDFKTIRKKQFMFLTQFFGGSQLYSEQYGHPQMRMRHLPHKITNEAKEEWLKCMKEAVFSLEIDEKLKHAIYNCFPPIAQHMVNS